MSSGYIKFEPPGPIARQFYRSMATIIGIMGPIGSAKTSTALMRIPRVAMRQKPSLVDGVRYSKFAVIRDTYRNLDRTTIPSWNTWVPKSVGRWSGGGKGDPASHHLKLGPLPDGSVCDVQIEFIALGDNAVEDVLRGWEGTAAYLNEADRLSPDVLMFLLGRLGRYPSEVHGGPSWSGVWADFNAPDVENYCYRLFEEKLDADGKPLRDAAGRDLGDQIAFFKQPSGYSPQAENLQNLPDGYYDKAALGQPGWYVRRFIKNEWGYSRDGKPVYPEFVDSLHVASQPLAPIPGLPLALGADAGRTPGVAIGQYTAIGQWRIVAELTDLDTGAARFGEKLNELLGTQFRDFVVGDAWCDPTALYKHDTDESTWAGIMREKTGITFRPAPSNNPLKRTEAVRAELRRLIDGGAPSILISPTCKALRKGFNSGYRYKRIQGANEHRYTDEPEKNEFSHIHDALQYLILGGSGRVVTESRFEKARERRAVRPTGGRVGFNPLARQSRGRK